MVGLVDILKKNINTGRWAGLARLTGLAILKKYKIPVDGLAGLAA